MRVMGGDVVGDVSVKMVLLDVGTAGSEVVVRYAVDAFGVEVDLGEAWRDLTNGGDWSEKGGVECKEGDADFDWSEGGNMGWAMMKGGDGVKMVTVWIRASIVGSGTEFAKTAGDDQGNEVGGLCWMD